MSKEVFLLFVDFMRERGLLSVWHDTVPSRTLLYSTVMYATLSPLLVHPHGLALQLDDATNNHALLQYLALVALSNFDTLVVS
jgi:hypothetical protein